MIHYNDLTVKSDNYLGEKRSNIMHDFKYVPPAEWKPVKERIIDLIHFVQNDVRNRFTFQYQFIGSSSRKMITRDEKTISDLILTLILRSMTMTKTIPQKK